MGWLVVVTAVEVWLDEIDVTGYALAGSSTRRLNRPSQAQVRLPMQNAIGGVGSLLKVYFGGVLHHHGRVLLCETEADEDTGYTVYNSTDPLELWQHRPVRDPPGSLDPGDMSNPTIVGDNVYGPQIVQAMIDGSENVALIPSKAEGPTFLAAGAFAAGSADLTGVPVDWPMTMADLATLLVGTGTTDIVITPIELTDSGFTCGGATVYNYGQIDVYNGDYGTDLSGTVAFQYGMGAYNVRALRWNEDMTNMCNKLWYYIGPRVPTIDDPDSLQHWRANVTASANFDPCVCVNPPACDTPNDIRDNIVALQGTGCGAPGDSRGDFGVRMDIKTFDAEGDQNTPLIGYCLYKNLWLREAWLRLQPQTLVHVTPTRDTAIGDFDIGDLVLVEASPAVRGGFSGVQRVYEYTVSWDEDSVPAIGELQTSPDNGGFGP